MEIANIPQCTECYQCAVIITSVVRDQPIKFLWWALDRSSAIRRSLCNAFNVEGD